MKINMFLAILLLVSLTFSSWYMQNLYIIKEPWDDYNWIEGDYTAAVCVAGQNGSFSQYSTTSSLLPNFPAGTFVSIDDSKTNNYMSYMRDIVTYDKPRREAYSCDCDEDGCSTCYRCVYDEIRTNLYGVGYSRGAWDIDLFNDAIKSIDLENIMKDVDNSSRGISNVSDSRFDFDGDTWGVKTSLRHAYERYQIVQDLYERCKGSSSYPTNQKLARTYGEKTISFEEYLAVYDPKTVSIPGSPCTVSRSSNPAGAECKNYPLRWMDSMVFAIDAIEGSFAASMQNIQRLRTAYNEIEKTGICDSDYPEEPKSACDRIKSALGTIDSHDSGENTFGQYERALEKEQELQLSIYCFPPDLEEYNEIMVLLWKENDGFNPIVLERKKDGENAIERANSIYSSYVGDALNKTQMLNAKEDELRAEKLELITESETTLGVVEALESIGTVSERTAGFYDNLAEADSAYGESLVVFGRKGTDYLKIATIRIKEAISLYSGLGEEADSVLEDAENIVNNKKQTAKTLVEQAAALYARTQNPDVGRYYQAALREMQRGDSAPALGDKYQYYNNAIAYARTALNNGQILENETMPLVNQLEDLIARAEIDGIDTKNEEDVLGYMKDGGGYDNSVLRELIESIITKAGIKYGHVSEIKKELLDDIHDTGGCAEGFLGDIERVDSGLVTTTGIDYLNAIGKLKQIEEEYQRISEDILACGVEMILSNLDVSSSIRIYEEIAIDAPTELSITIMVTNLGKRSAENIDVPVDLGLEMPILISDIGTGASNVAGVRTENGMMVFTINEIKPYRTFSIVIEKSYILAETIEATRTGIGKEDGSVDVTEQLTFDLQVRGRVAGQSDVLDTGVHTITRKYTISDGYEIEEEIEAYKLGTNVQVEKNIIITPKVDITTMPLTIRLDYPEVTGVTVGVVGASITNNDCGSTDTICNIEIGNLAGNEDAIVTVDFIVVNAEALLPTLGMAIPSTENCFGTGKKCGPLPAGLESMLAELNSAIEANDTARAIRLKEEIESKISFWNMEQEKIYNELFELRANYEVEILEIEEGLKDVEVNNTFIDSLKERKTDLEAALAAAEGAEDIVTELNILKGVDGKTTGGIITDFLKDSWDIYNELKVRLANAGVSTMPNEFIDVENGFSSLEISRDVKTGVGLSEALENAEYAVGIEEEKAAAEVESIYLHYDEIVEELNSLISTYNEQRTEAEGTEWETLFGLDTDKIETVADETKGYLDEGNIKMVKIKIEQLEKKKSKLEEVLAEIKDSAETTLIYARNSYEGKKDALSNEVRMEIENELSMMAGEISERDYIQAMQRGKQVLNKLANYKVETINPLLVVLALAAVGAAVGVYYLKRKGGDEIGGAEINLPFLSKKKKEYKKLAKAEV